MTLYLFFFSKTFCNIAMFILALFIMIKNPILYEILQY